MTQYNDDIVIIGGGIVGLTLALALATTKLRIGILEKQLPDLTKDSPLQQRVFAISRASQNLWQKLNVWPEISRANNGAYQKMEVWDSSGSGNIHFDCQNIGEPNLGHIINYPAIYAPLQQQITMHNNISIYHPITMQSIQHLDNHWQIGTEDGTVWQSRLLVGADGGNSWIRKNLNIASHEKSYQQHAIICTVHTEKPHQNTAWQCFTRHGPVAFLPLADPHESSIVWSTDQSDKLIALDDSEFCQALQKAFENKLGTVISAQQRFQFPLYRRHAGHYVKEGAALIGDAAHTIHPLAGQGINLGILDAATLAEVIIKMHQRGRNFASFNNLRPYERQRKIHVVAMLAAMDIFKDLFLTTNPALQWLRNTGLSFTNQNAALKKRFMRYAMGI